MKKISVSVFFSIALLLPRSAFSGGAAATGPTFSLRYEGGNLPSIAKDTVKAVIARDHLVLFQSGHSVSVPARNVTAVSCSVQAQRRFAAIRVPYLGSAETDYVGITWTEPSQAGEHAVSVVFRLENGEYHAFLAALERLTGKHAIDTGKVPTVVRYSL